MLPPGDRSGPCGAFRATRPIGPAVSLALVVTLFALAPGGRLHGQPPAQPVAADRIVLSFVGTTDLHGNVFPRGGRGGVAVLAGYVNNLREARKADGGAVVLVDSGDTYQGGIESNLSEGRLVVDAYNAMGYSAAAIGNHEFDFGGVDVDGGQRERGGDPRGALKAIAARARFPVLAANLIDVRTGQPVDWPNVKPSAIVEAGGLKVGLIGVMTIDALRSTLAVNTHGLRVVPLAPTIAAEASKLRSSGAHVVVVVAHAGGRCARFDDPADLSSCETSSEIFEVARQLPPRLVDVIMAGHTHAGLAHEVAGVAIVEAFSGGRAFGRVDVTVDGRTKRVAGVTIFAPRDLCLEVDPGTSGCDPAPGATAPPVPARYEGRPVVPDSRITDAMASELQAVRSLREMPLGVTVETPLRRAGDGSSALGNLFADAMRESMPGADAAIGYNLVAGGLRADLLEGPLTFGSLYDVFPFDNRMVQLTLTGAQLKQAFTQEIWRARPGALAVSGLRVAVDCSSNGLHVGLFRSSGAAIADGDHLSVVSTDFLVSSNVLGWIAPPRGFAVAEDSPIVREVVEDWLRRRGGHLRADQFAGPHHSRFEVPPALPAHCMK
jgi:5'-nucleotidase